MENTSEAEAPKVYGLVAVFDTPKDVYHAAEEIRDAGFTRWDVHTPYPIHGLDAAMGIGRSKVPLFTIVGGFIGFFLGNFISWYTGAFEYPLIVGGKPYFSPIFNFPVAYELTILLAAFGTLGGMFFLNRLPMPYHSVMNFEHFKIATDDKYLVSIEARDPKYDTVTTRALLENLGGRDITEIEE